MPKTNTAVGKNDEQKDPKKGPVLSIEIDESGLQMGEVMDREEVEVRHYQPGEVVEGKVVTIEKNKILLDLGGLSTGIITGREMRDSGNTCDELKVGDSVPAYIIEPENKDGHVVMSIRKAAQSQAWVKFEEALETDSIIEVVIQDANKGGLLMNIDGIKAFIPVSQLTPEHYPRVNNANPEEILNRLQQLVGQPLSVKVLTVDKPNNKMILSERKAVAADREKALDKIKVGDKVTGQVTGVVDFGVFVAFGGVEGLVHISEIAWEKVSDPRTYANVGDEIEALVIGVENGKISLSIKRLLEDRWAKAAGEFKIGQKAKGTIEKITAFGAFMRLNDDISGLIHISEISHKKIENIEDELVVGKEYEAEIISIDLEGHRIGLSLKSLIPNDTGKPSEKKTAEAEIRGINITEKAKATGQTDMLDEIEAEADQKEESEKEDTEAKKDESKVESEEGKPAKKADPKEEDESAKDEAEDKEGEK